MFMVVVIDYGYVTFMVVMLMVTLSINGITFCSKLATVDFHVCLFISVGTQIKLLKTIKLAKFKNYNSPGKGSPLTIAAAAGKRSLQPMPTAQG